jgi:dolichyl-phosphate-mannose--protein O-mannosyl transferase
MSLNFVRKFQSWRLGLCTVLVTLIGYCTYFRGYDSPPALFWDENYHIASAQKYLNRVFFLEPHPPVGKLFIALGEKLLSPNAATDQFLNGDYGSGDKLPKDFSFKGYRLFPALFGWMTAPLLFLIAFLLSESIVVAGVVSAFYLFDNALILQSRSAMLESTQIFFIALALLGFSALMKRTLSRRRSLLVASIVGGALGAAVATKVNASLFLVLLPLLLLRPAWLTRDRIWVGAVSFTSLTLVYFGAWSVHFKLGEVRNTNLKESGYYTTNQRVREIINNSQQGSFRFLPELAFENAVGFLSHYENGVPTLNLCKPTENGSPVYLWPIGARTISYRWQAADNNRIKYLYLVPNPVSWALAFLAVLATAALLFAKVVFPSTLKLQRPYDLTLLFIVWAGYMFAMWRIERVLYLYHYFIALVIGFLLVGVVAREIQQVGPYILTRFSRRACAALATLGSLCAFLWYAPFTYYTPLSDSEVRARALLPIWDLTCVGCPKTNNLAKPSTEQIKTIRFQINGLQPTVVKQDWGHPQIGLSAKGKPLIAAGRTYRDGFGMHSNAELTYPLKRKYSHFTAAVGLPDYLEGSRASVVFQVEGDDKLLWESPVIRPGEPLQTIDLDVHDVDSLSLRIRDAGDGITDDHGFWANLALTPR